MLEADCLVVAPARYVRSPSVVTLEILLPGVDKSKIIGEAGGSPVSRRT
jgi:hypothetical protein